MSQKNKVPTEAAKKCRSLDSVAQGGKKASVSWLLGVHEKVPGQISVSGGAL